MSPKSPKIAFIVDETQPQGTADDLIARDALREVGYEVDTIVWSQPNFPWLEYELYILRSPWDYYRRIAEFLVWGRNKPAGVRLLNDWNTVEWNIDKHYLLQLAKAGIPTVPTWSLQAGQMESLGVALSSDPSEQFIVKPAISAGSDRTIRLSRSELSKLSQLATEVFLGQRFLLQPYLEAVEQEGELSFVFFRKRTGEVNFSHAARKRPMKGDFRVQEEHGGSTIHYVPKSSLLALATSVAAAIDRPWLYARIDLIPTPVSGLVGEVELIEPSLYFKVAPEQAGLFCTSISSYLLDDVGERSHH